MENKIKEPRDIFREMLELETDLQKLVEIRNKVQNDAENYINEIVDMMNNKVNHNSPHAYWAAIYASEISRGFLEMVGAFTRSDYKSSAIIQSLSELLASTMKVIEREKARIIFEGARQKKHGQ